MTLTNKRKFSGFIGLMLCMGLFMLISGTSSCGYGFSPSGGTIPDTMRTAFVKFVNNQAPYRNATLAPGLTDRLRRKINNQTKLRQTPDENGADYVVESTVTDYSVSTSGVSASPRTDGTLNATINNLNIKVHVKLTDTRGGKKPKEFDVSRSFPYTASITLQEAETRLQSDILLNLADEIFNNLFSDW